MRTFLIGLGLILSACTSPHTEWTGSETVKRNTVELVRLVHDVKLTDDGTVLDASEQKRLYAFFDSIALGYGDELAIDPGDAPGADKRWAAVASHLAHSGLEVRESKALYGAPLEPGSARIIVGRYIVTPPNCPDWSKPAAQDFQNRPSSFLGCANVTNLGMMVANPRDLLYGRGDVSPEVVTATRAISQYRLGKAKKPSIASTRGSNNGSGSGSGSGSGANQ